MSSSSDNRLPTAVGRGGTGATATPANQNIGSGAGLISSLMSGGGATSASAAQKNDSSGTMASAASSSSGENMNDQKPQPGVIGQMWQK